MANSSIETSISSPSLHQKQSTPTPTPTTAIDVGKQSNIIQTTTTQRSSLESEPVISGTTIPTTSTSQTGVSQPNGALPTAKATTNTTTAAASEGMNKGLKGLSESTSGGSGDSGVAIGTTDVDPQQQTPIVDTTNEQPTTSKSTAIDTISPTSPKPPNTISKPNPTPTRITPKRRKKRRGLAAFFAALGCGGVEEFEDEDNKAGVTGSTGSVGVTGKGRKEMSQVGSSGMVVGNVVENGKNIKTVETREPIVSIPTTTNGQSSNISQNQNTTSVLDTGTTVNAPEPKLSNRENMGVGIGLGAVIATTGVGATALAALDDKNEDDTGLPSAPVTEPEIAPIEETEGLTSAAVQAPGSGAHLLHANSPHTHSSSSKTYSTEISSDLLTETEGNTQSDDIGNGDATTAAGETHDQDVDMDEMDDEDRLISQGGIGIPVDAEGKPAPLLPPMSIEHHGRKCLVLDLDETLLHSSFKMISSADYIVPVEIESQTHNVYVIKRPGVDNFLRQMGELYEVVVFTASLSKYADPVLDMLDVDRVVKHRLFRESCYNHKGNYVKDLSQLGREMHSCIIIDNSPASYIFHPNNAVPVSTWFNDPHDTELTDLCPFLADLETVDDIRGVLDGSL